MRVVAIILLSIQFFFPWLPVHGPAPHGQGGGTIPPPIRCELSAKEQNFAAILINSPEQQHPALACNAILSQVAREKAQDMATRGYFDHVDPDGYGPNTMAKKAGYPLPGHYDQSDAGNNIESIGGGYPSAMEVWQAFLGSPEHRKHMLGLGDYGEQDNFGIGYAFRADSDFKHYWVVLISE